MIKRIQKIIAATVLTFMLVFNLVPAALAGTDDNIVFADTILKQALIDAGIDTDSDGEITEGELTAYASALSLSELGISDISGLEFATNATSITLDGNDICNITALTGLTQLTLLDVSNNYLDISAGSDDMAVITTLTDAGCTVTYGPQIISVTGVSLDPAAVTLCINDTTTLSATVSPADASNKSVTWASSNTNAVTVSNKTITAAGVGEAIVTVTTNDGGYTAQCSVSVKSPNLASSVYTIGDGYIQNVAKLTSPEQLKNNLDNEADDVIIYNSDDTVFDGVNVATGMTAKLIIGEKVRDTVTIVIDGDVNGDGDLELKDYMLVRMYILHMTDITGAYILAADVDNDGEIALSDYMTIRLDILGESPTFDLPEVANPKIREFLDMALAQQGKPYVWSEEGPDSFDCSGYVYYCLNQVGYSVYRATANTYSKWSDWQYVDRDDLEPGDLMFYWSDSIPDRIGHIGIYLGNGYHIHASSSYGCVIICRIDGWYDEMLSHGRRIWSD